MKAILSLLAAFVFGPLGLCACRSAATPVPDAHSAATVFVAATAPAAPGSTLAPPNPEPGGVWTERRTGDLVIQLPAHWQVEERSAGTAAAILPAFEQGNPDLVGFLGGAGSALEVAFSARDLRSSAAWGFIDNLNIRRTAFDKLDGMTMPGIAATIADQYRRLGFDVPEITTSIEVGNLPAARIVCNFSVEGRDGKTDALSGLQLLVAAPDDLWILTYTTRSDRFAALRTVFEESAQSFRVK